MDLLQHVASAVAPVFLLTLIGLLWRRGGWAYDTAFVTRLSMTVSIPCLIFMALVRSDVDPRLLRDTVLAATAAYVGVGAVMAIIPFTFGIWVVAGGGSPLNAVREPLVWGTVLGGLFLLLGWRVPDWVGETLDLVGQMAIPLMLLTLGVAISGLRPRALGRALWLCLVKLGICVAVPLCLGLAFGLRRLPLGVLVCRSPRRSRSPPTCSPRSTTPAPTRSRVSSSCRPSSRSRRSLCF